jgi:hypothetical protein
VFCGITYCKQLKMTAEEFQKLLAKHLKGETNLAEKNQIEQFEQHFLEKNQNTVFSSDSEKAAIYRELLVKGSGSCTSAGWYELFRLVCVSKHRNHYHSLW